ncbi:hypothetical protein D9M72_531010 [compost metagenome]
MRAGAVGDEDGIFGPLGHALGADLAVGQVDRARHVAASVSRVRADHMQEHEILLPAPQRMGDVGAVGLDAEAPGEMGNGNLGGSGGGFGDVAHRGSPWLGACWRRDM